MAEKFGMEAALFCPSGTMTNQIAIKAHTQPLDEIICDKICHIYNYETGVWAFHSGVSIRLTDGINGCMNPEQIEPLIQPDFDWLPNTKMVAIENTVNKGGGSVYSIEAMQQIAEVCKKHNLFYHLDGARIFNALTALNKKPQQLHGLFHSISVCISKGLGAPVGSVLTGSSAFIKQSRKIRKVMGGGMRQSGLLAAACIHALNNNIERINDDHQRAGELATALKQQKWTKQVLPAPTNIVIFEVENASIIAQAFLAQGIRIQIFSPTMLRMVTHLDYTAEMHKKVLQAINTLAI